MKKVLSTVAALGLVAGLATSAAALELKVKGEYILDGWAVSEGLGVLGGHGVQTQEGPGIVEGDTDAWFEHKFQTDADLIINDKITIKSRIRFIDWGVWGKQDDTNISNGANFSVRRLWMVYKSPIGKWEIGRRPAGAWQHTFVNSGTRADRIMWKKKVADDFSMYAFYQKSTEGDAYANTDDLDKDYYEVYGAFTGAGKSALALGWNRDHSKDTGPTAVDTETWRIKGYGDYQFTDMLGLEVEFDYIWGDQDQNYVGGKSFDITGVAFMADLQAKFGDTQASAMYFYLSGDDNPNDTDKDAYSSGKGSGNDFEPLYVLTGTKTSILNNDIGGATVNGAAARTAGVHAIVLSADFQATEKLSLHGAFGWAEAADEMAGWDSDYGYELDAGLGYKLLDNLTYNLHFGWLATGDFFKGANPAPGVDANDVTVLYNNLSMRF